MTTNDDVSNQSMSSQATSGNVIEMMSDWEIVYLNLDKNICMIEQLRGLNIYFQVFENTESCRDYILSVRDHSIIVVVSGQHPIIYNCIWFNICSCSTVIFIYMLITKNIIIRDICKRHQSMSFFYTADILKSRLEELPSTESIVVYDQHDYLNRLSHEWRVFKNADLCLNALLETYRDQSVTLVLVLEIDYPELYDYLQQHLTSLFLENISSIFIVIRLYQSDPDFVSRKKYLIRQIEMCVDETSVVTQYLNDTSKMLHHRIMNNDYQQISLCSIRRRKFQLLIDYLTTMPHTIQSYQELINECRMRYKHDSPEQLKIDEFEKENFGENNAIKWYTRDAFIYRLLNEACRSESINLIYAFRSFIKDLYKQLESLTRPTGEIYVYRGQLMMPNELNLLQCNEGECFFTNTFLSTTFDYDVAAMYSGYGKQRPNLESVIFIYKLDTCRRSKPFADISKYSYIQNEREVLISMGTMFVLDSIEFFESSCVWHVHLTLQEYDQTMNNYCLLFGQDPKNIPLLLLLGKYLEDMNAFNDAEYFYRLYLEDESDSMHKSNLRLAYISIARVCQSKGEYATAIENLNTALNHCTEDDHTSRLEILLLTGDFFKKSNCWNDALNIFNQINETLTMSDCKRAQVINEIGEIYVKFKYWSQSIDVFQKALDLLHTVNYRAEKRLRSRIETNLNLAQLGIKTYQFLGQRTKPLFSIRTLYHLIYKNIRSLLIILPFYFFVYSMNYNQFIFNIILYWTLLCIGHRFAPTCVQWIDMINYRFHFQYRRTCSPYIIRFISSIKICQTIFFLYGLLFIMTERQWFIKIIIMLGCLHYSVFLRPCFVFISMQFLFRLCPGSISFIVGYLFMISDAFIQSVLRLYLTP